MHDGDPGSRGDSDSHSSEVTAMAAQIGKIYICGSCNAQVIVTKGGNGTLKCCGQEMQQKK